MKGIRFSLILAVCSILVAGCLPNFPVRAPSSEPTNELSAPILTETEPLQLEEDLSMEEIENAEYILSNGSTSVQLIDGGFEKIDGNDILRVSLLNKIVYADLDGDGTEDAAVVLVENYGGTGQFEYLIPVFNFGGKAFPVRGYFLGDRVQINTMSFDGSRIVLDMLVHQPDDGLCCPSQPMSRSLEYYPGLGFKLVHVTSGVEGSGYRDINLNEPVRGEHISSQFQISGSFTISPFEANLVVRIVDMQDQVVFTGSIMAPVANLGDPGTFTGVVDITSVNPPSGLVRIEVFEVSMADGSVLVMDSVLVILE